MTDYHSPRYGQVFMGYKGSNSGLSQTYVYPLAPDPEAYSAGIPAGDYPTKLNFIFRTSQYTSADAVSKCALIKDDADVFYYICSYRSGTTLRIYINTYDAPTNTQNVYLPTVPAEFTTDYKTTAAYIPAQCWFISKRNETEIDFIVVGDDVNAGAAGAKVVIQQYRWTIGDSTLTYITKYEYLVDGTASALGDIILGMALVDSQIVIVNARTYSGDSYWYVVEFTLDSGGSDYVFIDSTDKQAIDVAFFPAGNLVHLFAIYGIGPTATKECIGHLGAPWTMPVEAQVWTTGVVYGGSGDYNELIATYSGRMASTGSLAIWPEYGCNPDTGQVYFRLQYSGQGSNDIDCGECPLTPTLPCGPETIYGTRAYWTLPDNEAYTSWNESDAFGGSLSYDKSVGEYHEPGWWPTTTTGGLPQDTWFRFSFPSRNSNPTSILYTNGSPDYAFVIDWVTLDEYLVNRLYEVNYGSTRITRGAGQRNDNLPVLYDYVSTWSSQTGSIFIDKDNNEYARLQTFLGTANNPVTGSIGLYLVYENLQGRWMILGEIPEPVGLRPRWQVV